MKISLASSNGWRLRETPFAFQQTYVTPLSDLSRFVHALLTPFKLSEAALWIEQIIFTPDELIKYLNSFGIAIDEGELNRAVIHAEDPSETTTLLECVLGQWIDFAFIPSPKNFVIYADHDEYTTVFTANAELLASVHSNMTFQGFKAVDNWIWTGPHSPGKIEEGTNV
jgi:hypothetical protein